MGSARSTKREPLNHIAAGEGSVHQVARGGVEPPTFRFPAMRRTVVECRVSPGGTDAVRPVAPDAG